MLGFSVLNQEGEILVPVALLGKGVSEEPKSVSLPYHGITSDFLKTIVFLNILLFVSYVKSF